MNPFDMLPEKVDELRESLSSGYVIDFGAWGITQYMVWLYIALIVFIILLVVAVRKLTLVPQSRFANAVEYFAEFVERDVCEGTITNNGKKHFVFLFSLFFFILVNNLIGLIPGCKPGVGTMGTTIVLAGISFIYFNYWGIKCRGPIGYIVSIAPTGLPAIGRIIIWFFEFISLVMRFFTLAIRLFANMYAGHLLLGMFSILTSIFMICALQGTYALAVGSVAWTALLLVMYAMEFLVAVIQAYVFTLLSAVYINLATNDGH